MRNFYLCVLFVIISFLTNAQTTTNNSIIIFNSGTQDMFQSTSNPNKFTVNTRVGLPPEGPIEWEEGFEENIFSFGPYGGLDLGPFGSFDGFGLEAKVYAKTTGYFNIAFSINDFTGGNVEVNYPTDIVTVYPTDNSFNAGEWINLSTSYTVIDNAKANTLGIDTAAINTEYPKDGNIDFTLGANVTFKVGASFQVMPLPAFELNLVDLDLGMPETNVFHIAEKMSYYLGNIQPFGIPWTGPLFDAGGNLGPDPVLNMIPGYPHGYPNGYTNSPDLSADFAFPAAGGVQQNIPGLPTFLGQVWDPELPVEGSIGTLDGKFNIPNVETSSTIVGKNLKASGEDEYISFEFDIIKTIADVMSRNCGKDAPFDKPPKTPNPYCTVGAEVLGNLSNSLEQGIPGLDDDLKIYYTLINADLLVGISNKQEFEFKPTVKGEFAFSTPVEYRVTNAVTGNVTQSISKKIEYFVGDMVSIKYPCFYEELPIHREYNITANLFSNTYDEVDFSFMLDAVGFGIQIPGMTILPEYKWEICIPYGYPCGDVFWPSWCSGEWCESFTTPYIGFKTQNWNSCSIWSSLGINHRSEDDGCSIIILDESLGKLNNEWKKTEFNLEGFADAYFADTIIVRSKRLKLKSVDTVAALCYGDNGSVIVEVENGVPPYDVSWDGTINSSETNRLFSSLSLPAGNHTATITDVNNCEIIAGALIKEPSAPLSIIGEVINDKCNNSIGDGEILLEVNGGTLPYTYNWVGLYTLSSYSSNSKNINGLQPGEYEVTVVDANMCSIKDTFKINQPKILKDSNIVIENTNCFGTSDGLIGVEIIGGTLPYSYEWTKQGSSTIIGTGLILEYVNAGDYEIKVTDYNNCTFSNSYTITEPNDVQLSATKIDVDCFGNSTGEIDVTVSGGTPFVNNSYVYEWYNSNTELIARIDNNPLNLIADEYTLIVYDSLKCSETITVLVSQPNKISLLDSIVQNVNCKGDNTGSILVSSTGGFGNLIYDWSNDGIGDFNDTEDIENQIAGKYSLSIQDDNACLEMFNFEISEPLEVLNATYVVTDVKCFGEATGAINIEVTGGTAPYTFDWNNDGTGDFNDDKDLINLPAAQYQLIVKDSKGCLFPLTIEINQPTSALNLTESHTDVLCFGGSSGTIDLSVSGGTTPFVYEWYNTNSQTLSDISQDVNNLSKGSYGVIVTDANQCQENLIIPINEPLQPLSIMTDIIDVDCYNNNSGSITVSVSGGTTSYTYDWNNDGIGDFDDNKDLSSMPAGTYILEVKDANGCVEEIENIIAQPNNPLSIVSIPSAVTCFGEVDGNIILNVNGGTEPYLFDWDNDGTGDFDDNQDIYELSAGTYTIEIRDANGCLQTSGAYINEPGQPLTIQETVIEPSCFKYTDGSISLDVVGGTTPYLIEWGDQDEQLINNPSELLDQIGEGIYFYRVKDQNNCVKSNFITVGQPDTLDVDFDITDVTCYAGNDGAINLSGNGGTPPYNYTWSNGANTEDINNLITGNYSYVLEDVNGCIYKQSLFVDQSVDINIAYQIAPLSCSDQYDAAIDVQTAGGTQPYTWLWSNNSTNQSIDNLTAGIYSLTITDDYNCKKIYDFAIEPSIVDCIDIVNTFTPNDDDYNDSWEIQNLYLYPNAEVRVFNRWGEILYESFGEYTPWDGTYQGAILPSEVYFYIVKLNNQSNSQYTGTITIIR